MPPPIFTTPRGRSITLAVRGGTADWNTLQSCMTEDEYGLRDLHLTGVALDIGGYIGGVSVALLLDNPDLRVVCVEPIPENLAMIHTNLERAGVADRCDVIDGAAGYPEGTTVIEYDFAGDDGRVDDFAGQHRWVGNTFGNAMYCSGEHQQRTVPTYAIADLVPSGDIAFAKLDCEGGEWDFLDDPAVSRIAVIAGEWHPNGMEGTSSQQDIIDRLDANHAVTFEGDDPPGLFRAERR